jgi:hypothetical protein
VPESGIGGCDIGVRGDPSPLLVRAPLVVSFIVDEDIKILYGVARLGLSF